MSGFLLALALFLVLNILAGLVRALRGPTPADRILASTLLGTTGAATLLLLAEATASPALRDVALVFVLVAPVPVVVFRRRLAADAGMRAP
jgi:multicomponent Na+:H+ antiporter subunit F